MITTANKRFFSILIAFQLIFIYLISTHALEKPEFTDVKSSSWYYKSIRALTDRGVLSGYPDGSFKPDASINVDEFLKIFISFIDREPDTEEKTNESKTHWANYFIKKAIQWRLIGDTEYKNYSRPITRGEMSKFIASVYRLIENVEIFNKMDGSGLPNCAYPLSDFTEQISDLKDIPEKYREYVLIAYAKGAIDGFRDGTFRYSEAVTRAQVATILNKMFLDDNILNLEVETGLKLPKNQAEYKWNRPEEKFYIVVDTKIAFGSIHKITRIAEDGSYEEYSVDGSGPQFKAKLSDRQLEDLFNNVINKNHFFELPSNVSSPFQVLDSGTTYITIGYGNRVKLVGGYHPDYCNRFTYIINEISKAKDTAEVTYNEFKNDVQNPIVTQGATTLKEGDYLQIGKYNEKPIIWKFVKVENDSFLVADEILCYKAYDAAESGYANSISGLVNANMDERIRRYGSGNWANSNIREWLNSNEKTVFYSTFPPIKSAIVDGKNPYNEESGFLTNFSQNEFESIVTIPNIDYKSYTISFDKVWLLDYEDIESLIRNGQTNILVKSQKMNIPDEFTTLANELFANFQRWVWARGIGWTESSAAVVNIGKPSGDLVGSAPCTGDQGVLPAMKLGKRTTFSKGTGTFDDPYMIQ